MDNLERRPYCDYCDEYSDRFPEMHNHEDDGPMCECGHYEEDHHISWFRNGYKLVEECEFFGSNETGGLEWKDATWSDHCQKFRRASEPGRDVS